MLSLKECEERVSELTEEELHGLSNAVHVFEHFYKHGKYPEYTGMQNQLRVCILCQVTRKLAWKYSEVQCKMCPWFLLENMHCSDWFHKVYHGPSKCTISEFRHIRQQHFTAVRIKMLAKWFRRLNALANRRRQGRDKYTLKRKENV